MRISCTCGIVLDLVSVAMNLIAPSCVKILFASWIDGMKWSSSSACTSKSRRQNSRISRSDRTPRARITMKSGTGERTLGIFTTICLFVRSDVGATIRTESVLSGLDASSLTVRISAACVYTLSSLFSRIYSILSANFS